MERIEGEIEREEEGVSHNSSCRRLLSMNALQNQLVAQQKRIVQVMEGIAQKSSVTIQEEEEEDQGRGAGALGTLTLLLVRAERLPRMDLLRSCDPYCILFLDGEGSRDSYMSKIIRKQVNPTWAETFEWKVYSNSTIVIISVWDKDNVSRAAAAAAAAAPTPSPSFSLPPITIINFNLP